LDQQAGDHQFKLTVTDNGSPKSSASQSFTIHVVARPSLAVEVLANGSARLSWDAIAGVSYQVQFAKDLTGAAWTNLGDPILATGKVAGETDTTTTTAGRQRFYRVVILP
jgi:hypothetical protein